MRGSAAYAIAALLLLGGCVRLVPESVPPRAPPPPVAPPVAPPAPPAPATAALLGLAAGPSVTALGLGEADAAAALASFRESCPKLLARGDVSGLTRTADWQAPCDAAGSWPAGSATSFFTQYFETLSVGQGTAFATGYYEPEIAGSRTRAPGYEVPIYALPPELVRDWPQDIPEAERNGRPPLGRYDAQGKFVPYYERAEIEQGVLANRGLEIAWAADPLEFFFLQVQGSGMLRLPDGTMMRIGYAGQNGREYVGIGAVMKQRGLIGPDTQYPSSMQGIMAWLRDHPDEAKDILDLNKSWVFFRELTSDGPLGALGVPVRGQSSAAVDPNYVPLGAPVWLSLDRTEASGLWIAQDTGGAIKGPNRFDTFWGSGPAARETAGGMSARGQALVLVPKGTVSRLTGQ